MFPRALAAACICFTLTTALAQPPATEAPSDTKAYNAANALSDPEKKMEAFLKLRADFPDSPFLQAADLAVLSTLVKKFPTQTDRIRRFAAQAYRRAPQSNRGSVANLIALELLAADLLLQDARNYARDSVDSPSMSSFVREQLAAYEDRGQTPPWSQELEKRYRELRAGRVATLGRVELKLGHTAAAQTLLEQAHAILPNSVSIQAGLGEVAAKSGNRAAALEYLIPAQLTGTAPKNATAALQSIYRQQHGDSLAGFDEMLDAEYRKRFPNPVSVDPWQPSANRTSRVVLAEVFTGSGCAPCAAVDLAFDAVMLRYPRKDVAVVMYHQHVPRPDPMTNPYTLARNRSYGISGVPTVAIDGKRITGGGPREIARQTYYGYASDIERALDTPAEASIRAEASLTANTVRVKATVDRVSSNSPDLKVQVALVEKALRFSGESGIRFHPMVVRAMAGKDGGGFALQGAPATIEPTFDLAALGASLKSHLDTYEAGGHRGEPFTFAEKMHQIDRAGLAVVVFVQDEKTKRVLQAAYVDLGVPPTVVTEAAGSRR